jgi:hypothetical protein
VVVWRCAVKQGKTVEVGRAYFETDTRRYTCRLTISRISECRAVQDEIPASRKNRLRKTHLLTLFIGHVDAGKSTMGGNILYLCGMVDKRTLEKYEREAKEAGRENLPASTWPIKTMLTCGLTSLSVRSMHRHSDTVNNRV